jgi:hypothetical protein
VQIVHGNGRLRLEKMGFLGGEFAARDHAANSICSGILRPMASDQMRMGMTT